MRDAYDTGRRVLEAFDRGRDKVNDARRRRSASLAALVREFAERDAAAGRPERGRAARVARRLAKVARPRTVYEHFAALFSSANSD